MKMYADLPARRSLQVLGDLLLVAWLLLWIRLGGVVHHATLGLAAPGRKIDSSASGLAGNLRDAGSSVSQVPLVGDAARKPFDGAGGAADQLAAAGRAQVHAVETLAFWLGLTIALIPILIALAIYLPRRIRFVRRATAGQRFLDDDADLDLFALRAMARQPLHVLARISDNPAGAWRAQDRDVIHRLATVELRESGLRPPQQA
jgi:hypothetical protein